MIADHPLGFNILPFSNLGGPVPIGYYYAMVLSQHPDAFYPLDDAPGSTSARDLTAAANNGTYGGSPAPYLARCSPITSQPARSAQFATSFLEGWDRTGTAPSDFNPLNVQVPGAAAPDATGWSVSFFAKWVSRGGEGEWMLLLGNGPVSPDGGGLPSNYLYIGNGECVAERSGVSASVALLGGAGEELAGAWHHICVAVGADTASTYVDGAPYITDGAFGLLPGGFDAAHCFFMGPEPAVGGFGNIMGYGAALAFWSRKLTAAEVADQYAASRDETKLAAYRNAVLSESTLVGTWPLAEPNGGPAQDMSWTGDGTYHLPSGSLGHAGPITDPAGGTSSALIPAAEGNVTLPVLASISSAVSWSVEGFINLPGGPGMVSGQLVNTVFCIPGTTGLTYLAGEITRFAGLGGTAMYAASIQTLSDGTTQLFNASVPYTTAGFRAVNSGFAHVAWLMTTDELSCYVNGELQGTVSTGGAGNLHNGALAQVVALLGSTNVPGTAQSDQLAGYLSEFSYYETLTPGLLPDIPAHYAAATT